MRYLHTMIRVLNLEASVQFYTEVLGLKELRRSQNEKGRFTLVFIGEKLDGPMVELTHNWDQKEAYSTGRNFGHLAFGVKDIYQFCENAQKLGVEILRPPRDGYMAFIKDPDGVSIELLQEGPALEVKEPWKSMENKGQW